MKTGRVAIFSALMLASLGAGANDLVIVPSVGLGQSNMDFRRSIGENDVATFNVVEVALTASYKGFFVRGNTEIPLGETYTYGPSLVRQFKREDAALTLGWYPFETFRVLENIQPIRNLAIFTGYSHGKTGIISYDGGSGLPPYAVYTEHLDKGWYYGLSSSINVANAGSISLSVAYASMDGSQRIQPSSPGAVSSLETGTTDGLSYGLTWVSSLGDKATYYLSWKRRNYTTELVTISIEKDFSILSAGFVFPL